MSSTWSTTKLRGNWLRHLQGPLGARTRKLPLHRELPDTSSTKTRSAGCSKNSGQDISATLELLITMNSWIGEKLELEFQEERCEFDSPCSLLLGCFVVAVELNRRPGVPKRFQCTRWYPPSHLPLAGLVMRKTAEMGTLICWGVLSWWTARFYGSHKVAQSAIHFQQKEVPMLFSPNLGLGWAEGKKQNLWQRWISFLLNTTKHHDHTIYSLSFIIIFHARKPEMAKQILHVWTKPNIIVCWLYP